MELRTPSSSSTTKIVGAGSCISVARLRGKLNVETRAGGEVGPIAHRARVGTRNGVADRKSQSGAALLGREERIEEALHDLGSETGPIVDDRELHFVLCGQRGANQHPASTGRPRGQGFETVTHEIQDDMLDLPRVD